MEILICARKRPHFLTAIIALQVSFGVRDRNEIDAWEGRLRNENGGPPLAKFYQSLVKTKTEETLKAATDQENLADYDFIPKMKTKKEKKEKKSSGKTGAQEFKDMFEEDDSDSELVRKTITL